MLRAEEEEGSAHAEYGSLVLANDNATEQDELEDTDDEESGLEDEREASRGAAPDVSAHGTPAAAAASSLALSLAFRSWAVDSEPAALGHADSDDAVRESSAERPASHREELALPTISALNPLSFMVTSNPPTTTARVPVECPGARVLHRAVSVPEAPLLRLAGHAPVEPAEGRPWVTYELVVDPQLQGEEGGWAVKRRFSQFAQLHQALMSQHEAALQRSNAALPNKLRWPSSLEAEGAERLPQLQEFLSSIVLEPSILSSQALTYFVGANHTSARRVAWEREVGARS